VESAVLQGRAAACAALNAGELGSIPLLGSNLSRKPPPLNDGSGKFDSPCDRMHWENLSIAARWLADSVRAGPPPGSFE
jgi:hypothetical protein